MTPADRSWVSCVLYLLELHRKVTWTRGRKLAQSQPGLLRYWVHLKSCWKKHVVTSEEPQLRTEHQHADVHAHQQVHLPPVERCNDWEPHINPSQKVGLMLRHKSFEKLFAKTIYIIMLDWNNSATARLLCLSQKVGAGVGPPTCISTTRLVCTLIQE